VDVPLLDRPDGHHRRPHQTPPVGLSPVAAVCDRRRPQGRDAAPSGSHSRGFAAPSASPREPLCNFRQDDRICRIEAKRRKTAAGSPKGEQSESINRSF
jgi:hypothetical protein